MTLIIVRRYNCSRVPRVNVGTPMGNIKDLGILLSPRYTLFNLVGKPIEE